MYGLSSRGAVIQVTYLFRSFDKEVHNLHTESYRTRNLANNIWGAGTQSSLCIRNINTVAKKKLMPSVGFEPTIPGNGRLYFYALARTETGISWLLIH